MKLRNCHLSSTIISTALLISHTQAVDSDGIWNTTSSPESWNAATNWLDDIIATGSGYTADFSSLDITEDTTVTLDDARTIGNLIFGDIDTETPGGWILSAGLVESLTLDGLTPTITVDLLASGNNATLDIGLAGSNGFTKAGTGTLRLLRSNTNLTGPITLSGGILNYANGTALGDNPITYTTGTILQAGVSANLANPIHVDAEVTGTVGTNIYDTTLSGAITGDGTLAKGGGAPLTLTGGLDNTIAGGLIVASGRLNVTDGLSLTNTGPVTVLAGGSLNYSKNFAAGNNLSNNITLSGAGVGTFGALNLQGNVDAIGEITLVDDSTISHNFNNATISGTITGEDRNLRLTTLTTSPNISPGMVVNGDISLGTGSLTIQGGSNSTSFSIKLNGFNDFSGGTNLLAGTLNFGSEAALGSGSLFFDGNSTLQAGLESDLWNDVNVAQDITGTFDTNGHATTLSGVISGDGVLAKSGAGTLTLTGGIANTITGGIRVDTGTLKVVDGLSLSNTGPVTVSSGASLDYSKNFAAGNNLTNDITISGSGDGLLGALNIWGNATATGTITLADDASISHSYNNATISGPINGTDHNLTLSTLNPSQPGMTVSGPISLGSGGITVQGAANSGSFSIRLSGSNSYSGETHVVSGTLMLSGDTRIDDNSSVRIDSGTSPAAVLHLDFNDTDIVASLILGGEEMPTGTYGAVGSGADNESAFFAGTGILEVGAAPAANYSSWAAANGIAGEPFGGDFNGDGISNGVAYALGLDPITADQLAGDLAGGVLSYIKGAEAIINGDVSWIIQTSTDLGINDPWLDAVTQDTGDASTTITIDLNSSPGTPKKFARLKVLQVP